MKPHRPHGLAPTTLEADILKLRAFEMVLILFYMEDLKAFIIDSIETTHEINGTASPLPLKKKMDAARKLLVVEGCISQAESDEILRLVNYRNTIGHQIHALTCDIGAYSELGDFDPNTYEPVRKYDYSAAKGARQLRKKVSEGMAKKFSLRASLNGLRFEAAERIYLTEIQRLTRKVNKRIRQFNETIVGTAAVIRKIPAAVLDRAQPGHPRNIKNNGTLSESGVNCIFQLFDVGVTPLAVAYLMRVSVRSANAWHKKWVQAEAPY
ncbi:hypothetical protein [Pseudomonas chlororaphis]|uniref:hypothetical protein n=1 Tax=Pseudomonas chlororaphis TaxID=587753 RepID=UPI0006A62F07|nr:hypothetical protein [Pseudomonas chlororaphis]AZD00716.1 hypothetical protein C4K27_1507 [Pseudomonas chlororaphis subsp. chlororaphis]MBM0283385.1 hypothetical protein [Pseudomonas chlororaphis]MDO1503712.1 hypothetical protein [Pseudomonas chlororaphis]ORM48777.1 hypothetical protein B6D51_04735 [Pseudomonas chlororaphis subsp. chlororaphis]TWR95123.1 hypothetical protein FJD36_18975 [Pseudomonas chlororaphis subsp. chlororaphis]